VLAGIRLRRQRDFKRADLAEMQVRAQSGSGMRGWLVALSRVTPQAAFEEAGQLLFRRQPAAFDPQRGPDGVIDFAASHQLVDVRWK
jgi:hypothetical protein